MHPSSTPSSSLKLHGAHVRCSPLLRPAAAPGGQPMHAAQIPCRRLQQLCCATTDDEAPPELYSKVAMDVVIPPLEGSPLGSLTGFPVTASFEEFLTSNGVVSPVEEANARVSHVELLLSHLSLQPSTPALHTTFEPSPLPKHTD
jgi:hypothetical protein